MSCASSEPSLCGARGRWLCVFRVQVVKVWNLTNCKLRQNLLGHSGYINTVTVSPDGSLCASGGKDGVAMLWDLSEGKRLYRYAAHQCVRHFRTTLIRLP